MKIDLWNWKISKSVKEVNGIWKNYQNNRKTPAILPNGTLTLMHSEMPNYPSKSEVRQHQLKIAKLVSRSGKDNNALKEINKI